MIPSYAEVFDGHAEVGDARFGVRASLRQADVLRTRPNPETDGISLAMLHGEPEQTLVKLHRALPV